MKTFRVTVWAKTTVEVEAEDEHEAEEKAWRDADYADMEMDYADTPEEVL